MAIDLAAIFHLHDLDEEEKLKRRILLRIIFLTVAFGIIWGIFYIAIGLVLPGLVPISYGIISLINLFAYSVSERYNFFRTSQLILILLLPTGMQLSLGTFNNSSAVVLAAVLCPMGALMFHTVRSARMMFGGFILMTVLSGLYAAFIGSSLLIDNNLSITFFVLNIIVICSIVFAMLEYFVEKKNHMQNLLAQKNKDITDSITYAKRIQQAILPSDRIIRQLLPDSFILYQPKDIVSGDFYWIAPWGRQVLFAAVDCTGHGVPGAFMSIVGQNLLNQAVNEHGLSRPNLVLNALNKEVSRTLGANEASQVTDGMDIALCSIDMDTMMLQFAGAFNPAWILRQGEIIELRGDKFPIGSFVDSGVRNFQNIEFQLQEGDIVYVFTDGYADQFGGPKGKKFKYKNIKSLLIENASASMSDQKMILERTIRDWKGDLEQIDDILVMGVRVGRKAAVSF